METVTTQQEGEQHLGCISPVEEAIYYYNGFIQSESAYSGIFFFKRSLFQVTEITK